MQFKEFFLLLSVFVILAMTAYLLFSGKLNAFAGALLILATGIFSVLILESSEITALIGSWGDKGSFRIEMKHLRDDVYARAEAVKHLGEEVARFAAHTVATANRFSGDDHTQKMLEERERIRELMKELGSEDKKILATLQEIDKMALFDLKRKLYSEVTRKTSHPGFTSTKPLAEIHNDIWREIEA